MESLPKSLFALLLACLAPLAAGCAPSETAELGASAQPSAAVPEFAGSFADEYTEAWNNSESRTVRAILGDEKITDQEWSQVLASLDSCLAEHGVALTKYHPDGSYEADTRSVGGEAGNDILGSCEKSSGEAWIGYLYRSQTVNPDNTPPTQLLTDCLVRNGAVPASYTEEQYLQDAPDMSFPYVDEHGREVFEACNQDFAYNE